MKDQMIIQNFINTFHFIQWINQPTLSETIPFDKTAFMTAKQIWIQNIKDTSQQAIQLKNKAQQLMRVLQYDCDGLENQYEIQSENKQSQIYKYKNKFIKSVQSLNRNRQQSYPSTNIDAMNERKETKSTRAKNQLKRTQNEQKLMQEQQYKKEQKDKQVNMSKQRLKIQSKQIQIQLKSKQDHKQKQKNGKGRTNYRDQNIDHSNNQTLKQYCTQKPNFYRANTEYQQQSNIYNLKETEHTYTPNKYNPQFPNNLKSKPITKIVELNKMQYKKQIPYLSQINKVYIHESMQPNPIIQSQKTKLKTKAQCLHINYQYCHSCNPDCPNLDKLKQKQVREQDHSREFQRNGRNRIKSINLKSNYNKKQERNNSFNQENENKGFFTNNKFVRGRTYTQSIQSDPNSNISEYNHFIKTPPCRRVEKVNKISRMQFSKTQNMSSDNYDRFTHPQYLNSQPQILTQIHEFKKRPHFRNEVQNSLKFKQNRENRESQKQKTQLFQDDLDLEDNDFMQQQVIREKMEELEQKHMKEQLEKIQYARKVQIEMEERKKIQQIERIRKINQQKQRNKKLQQKQRIQKERQQKKRQNNLLHKLREQFSSIGQHEHNQDEKKVSEEIKELEIKLNEIISNNHKSRRTYQDHSPSAKIVKLNLTPSRSNIHKNNAMNCNKTQTPRASTNKSNTLLTKKISVLNSRVI